MTLEVINDYDEIFARVKVEEDFKEWLARKISEATGHKTIVDNFFDDEIRIEVPCKEKVFIWTIETTKNRHFCDYHFYWHHEGDDEEDDDDDEPEIDTIFLWFKRQEYLEVARKILEGSVWDTKSRHIELKITHDKEKIRETIQKHKRKGD